MGGTGWRKALRGFKLCVHSPLAAEGDGVVRPPVTPSDPSATSPSPDPSDSQPPTPTQSSSGVRPQVSTSGTGLSKRTCAICLTTMKPGQGHAIFTAECSHSFHFHCIASCIKYGNHVCPVCRAKWKEIPFQGPNSPGARSTVNPLNINRRHAYMSFQHPLLLNLEPCIFNDDEALDATSKASGVCHSGSTNTVVIKTYPEYSAIPESISTDNFTILIHLKAPLSPRTEISSQNAHVGNEVPRTHRAPVDIVTVLDVSGSMSGTKLALLKQAMGFVIQNLGPLDRLSVIAFSSTARRLFPLRRMSEFGRQEALQAVNALATSGGTNITEGLRKGAKVIEERKEKNPVCSIILLSDGQDTYLLSPTLRNGQHAQPDYRSLVPSSIRDRTVHNVPVHAFGFGSDHDSVSMHSISETSGGTFSFIEAEGAIQDAFAQCIGGLLSVVVQEMHVQLECLHHDVKVQCIKSGRYASWIRDSRRSGTIDAGDLYADEERDYLVSVNVPPDHHETQLLKVSCLYSDPVTKGVISPAAVELKISRPELVVSQPISIEVDRQRNRLQAAEAMAKAKTAAEHGELSEAVCLLEECRKGILESEAAKSGDQLCATLDAELREMQTRMVDRQRYLTSGRAYVLSGLSSHLCQRATVRGDSTHSGSFTQAYQTPSMADMIQRSQTFSPVTRHSNSKMRHTMSFPAGPKPM